MARKTIASRITNSELLALDLEGFARKLTAALRQRFGEMAADSELPVPDQGPTLELFALALREAREELIRRDEEHGEQAQRARDVRWRRDRLAKDLGHDLARLRSGLRARLGHGEADQILGLNGRTTQDPLVLHRKAHRAVANLAQTSLSDARDPGPGLMRLHQEIEAQLEALKAAIEKTSRAKAREESTLIRRKQAAQALDAVYQPARRLLLSLGELAQVPDVAHLLKLRATKVGRPRKKETAPEAGSVPRSEELATPETAPARAEAEIDVLSFRPRALPRSPRQGLLVPTHENLRSTGNGAGTEAENRP